MPNTSRYFISFVSMTPEAGSNPMGHACIYFLKEMDDGRIQVLDAIGYYAKPPSSDRSCHGRLFKKLTHLDINFTKGYGHFEREEVRYMDKASLPSVTYMISEAKYHELKSHIKSQMATEERVVAELTLELERMGVEKTHYKGHSFYRTDQVMDLEIEKAAKERRAPRLKLFEMRLNYSWKAWQWPSVSLANSIDCKIMALDILKRAGVDEKELEKFGRGHTRGAFPLHPLTGTFNYRGTQSHLLAHSIGEPRQHHSPRTGHTYHFRAWSMSKKVCMPSQEACQETAMYLSLPPQNLLKTDSISDSEYEAAKNDYTMDKQLIKKAHSILSQLQFIEYDLMNATFDECGKADARFLIDTLRDIYQCKFSAYTVYQQDSSYLDTELQKAKELLKAIEHGFHPYTRHFELSINGKALHFEIDEKTNDAFCDRFDRDSSPFLDLHIC